MANESWGESRVVAVYTWMQETHNQDVMEWYTQKASCGLNPDEPYCKP